MEFKQKIVLEFKKNQGWSHPLALKSPLSDDYFVFYFNGEALLEEYLYEFSIEKKEPTYTYIFRVKGPVIKEKK